MNQVYRLRNSVGGNYTEFEADGTVVFNGNATVWDDIIKDTAAIKPGVSAPNFDVLTGAVRVYAFTNNAGADEEVHLTFEMRHSYKEGTNVTPHMHIVPNSVVAAPKNVIKFGFEYEWQNDDSTYAGSTTIYQTYTVVAGDALKKRRIDFAAINGAGKNISGNMIVRVFRTTNTDATDTYTDKVFLAGIGLHFEIDTVGSRQIAAK